MQLICAMMDYVLLMWTSAARANTRKSQVLQSWHCYQCTLDIGTRQIHKDLGFSLFAEHITSLIERFNSKLAGVENSLMQGLSRSLLTDC